MCQRCRRMTAAIGSDSCSSIWRTPPATWLANAKKWVKFYHYFATGDGMKEEINSGQILNIKIPPTIRKPHRPRAIPTESESVVLSLYRLGYGYRVISWILRTDHHLNPDFSTVKKDAQTTSSPASSVLPTQPEASWQSHFPFHRRDQSPVLQVWIEGNDGLSRQDINPDVTI